MSGSKEIRTQIRSITSTQKITRAMEMVAASKMRKAQEQMEATRPYASRILNVIDHLARGNSEYQHKYLIPREIKRRGLIIISSDRGLCGGLNVNLFRFLNGKIEAWKREGAEVDLCIIGTKAEVFFRRLSSNIIASTKSISGSPTVSDVISPVRIMLDKFDDESLDSLSLAFNSFVNTMVQRPKLLDLLPILPRDNEDPEKGTAKGKWDYIYEPEAKELLDSLLSRHLVSQVYQGVVENYACEQAARMVAMKSATDNAGDFIDRLQLDYNKARQAAITQELSEIVAGAAAV